MKKEDFEEDEYQEEDQDQDDLENEEGDDDTNLTDKERQMKARDKAIQDAMAGPTYHKFSDYDKTPQGQKAISLGIKNVQGGKATYDYTKVASADFSWPDLQEDKVGSYEPWLCYGFAADSGWMDLNAIANGKERRGVAAYRTQGYCEHEALQRCDKETISILEGLEKLNDTELALKATEYGFKKNDRYSYRDYLLGMRLDYQRILQKSYATAQKGLDAANAFQKEEMNKNIQAAKSGGLLDPYKGVSLEDWAAANAKIVNGTPLDEVMKVLGLEKPVWDDVSAEWTKRMSQDTTFAITTVYGNAFVDSNIGRFGKAAAPAAQSGGAGTSGMQKVLDDFDLYVKIMCHQSAASTQGIDAQSVLKQYGLTAADWGTVGGKWNMKMTSDMTLAMKMGDLMQKYTAEFSAPKAGDDIQF